MTRANYVLGASIVASLLIGGGAGYLVAQKRLEAEFDVRLAEETEATKAFYSRANKTEEFATPESAVKALLTQEELAKATTPDLAKAAAAAVKRYHGDASELGLPVLDAASVKIEAEKVVQNVFDQAQPEPEEVGEVTRDRARPYVVTEDEHMLNETGYTQVTVTYFVKDDTVADERDEPMTAINATFGAANLQAFAHSPDTTFYIRNDALRVDFEVNKSTGAFSEEVLGLKE